MAVLEDDFGRKAKSTLEKEQAQENQSQDDPSSVIEPDFSKLPLPKTADFRKAVLALEPDDSSLQAIEAQLKVLNSLKEKPVDKQDKDQRVNSLKRIRVC